MLSRAAITCGIWTVEYIRIHRSRGSGPLPPRQMETPPSPPDEVDLNSTKAVMSTLSRVLAAKGEALTLLSRQFEAPAAEAAPVSEQVERALHIMRQTVLGGGKLVYTGMGKSLKIAAKLVATLHSFSIPAVELHPSDALHGDVGVLTCSDVLIMISVSGNSPELSLLLKHTPPGIPIICLTCEAASPLAEMATAVVALPFPPHLRESTLYGLPAPTVSTTLCLAMGDAMNVALFESLELDAKQRRHGFLRCHPGGAIGVTAATEQPVVPWELIAQLERPLRECSQIELWRGVALAPVVCAAAIIYRSADIIYALENQLPLAGVPGVPLAQAPSARGSGLCVFRDATSAPVGVVWD